jgi:hypothetical protein
MGSNGARRLDKNSTNPVCNAGEDDVFGSVEVASAIIGAGVIGSCFCHPVPAGCDDSVVWPKRAGANANPNNSVQNPDENFIFKP